MANGTGSDEFVVRSRVRPGLKRELTFALAQAEVSCSLGRTRARNALLVNVNRKRLKKEAKSEPQKDDEEEKPASGGENVKVVEDLVEAISEEDAKSDVVDLMSDDEPRSHAAESKVVTEDELKNGVVEMAMDNEQNVGSVGNEDEAKREQLKKEEPEKPDSIGKGEKVEPEKPNSIENGEKVEGEVIEKPLRRYTRSASRRKSQVAESKLTEKVCGDEMKNGAVDMAIDTGCGGDSVNEDEPKQEEQPLVKLEILNLIEKGDTVEGEVSETPQRRYTRSALKLKSQVAESILKVSEDETKNGVVDMAIDDEPNTGSVGDSVAEDEPRQEELKKSESEQPLVKLEILDLIEKGDKVECEANEKPQRRFTRSTLNTENEALDFNSVSQKSAPAEVETKMRKTVKKFRLLELLETGILEGQRVTYLKGSKGRKTAEKGLTGVITGSAIMCHCERCNGTDGVSPAIFELHAESANKRPPEYIYLENGKTLRDVLTACNSSLETLEEAVRLAVGRSSIKTCTICLNCKGSICKDDTRSAMLLCRSCLDLKETQAKLSVAAKPSEVANDCSELPKPVSVANCPDTVPECPDIVLECPNAISRCHDTVSKCLGTISNCPDSSPKCPDTVLKSRSSASKSRGRVTRKDTGMHKLVFEDNFLPDGTEVVYVSGGQRRAVGYKKGSGIMCSCCNTEVSPSQFEAHAGCSSRRKPYHNIFISNGVSLHELALKLSKKRRLSTEDSDDLCFICRKGGKVICCDSCPRVFHAGCLSLPTVPNGTWYCKHCQTMFDRDIDAERNVNAVAAGRVAGVDPIKQITNRCIRIVTACDEKFGGCALCRGHEFKNEGFGPGTVILCDQCEREFHVGCLKEKGIVDLKEVPKEKWFCHPDCLRVHSALQKLVVHGQQKLPESLLNVVRKKKNEKGPAKGGLDIKWRVLSGKMSNDDESLQLLSKALAIFHDQFAPIVDKESGLDFIREMLYGGAIKTQDFAGMYCAIVTLNESVVSAAMFRIYGTDVAELPLVATSADCQGQGYFQTLFSCIERLLAFLNVKILLLPAADKAASIWTKKFGFQNLNQSEIHEYRKRYPILIFHGTSVLQKSVPKRRVPGSQESKAKVESS
ncbi:uncharacterized protein LOC133730101 [Rosa rugosa]|uniref:uncharacterized protein LOC133730101 n=1 Tax=Rosa rugosa TaxID=74645 RepID=UPI002B40B994|nr:uncharacterized protein LOC133730101 [Rosa rugosa]